MKTATVTFQIQYDDETDTKSDIALAVVTAVEAYVPAAVVGEVKVKDD